eukprot:m.80086 g.80086  ORF g.80086 m.80086 type:complete len:336 (-) comp14822_c0_seq1:21-1028(-)
MPMSAAEIFANIIAGALELVAVGCYFSYKSELRYIRDITNARPVGLDKAREACKDPQNYVVVEGYAHTDHPIVTEGSNVQCVTMRETVHEISQSYRGFSQNERHMHTLDRAVEFELRDKQTWVMSAIKAPNAITIVEPIKASREGMEEVGKHFRSVSSFGNTVMGFFRGEHILGYRTVQEAFTVGSHLFCIGTLELTESGTLRLRSPLTLPFVISRFGVEKLIQLHKSSAQFDRYAAMFCAAVGTAIALLVNGRKLWQMIDERRRRYEMATLMETATEVPAEELQAACVVCLSAPKNVVLLNCGHVCVCAGCAQQLQACPICRAGIARINPIFVS